MRRWSSTLALMQITHLLVPLADGLPRIANVVPAPVQLVLVTEHLHAHLANRTTPTRYRGPTAPASCLC